MFEQELEKARQDMLKGGISPKYVGRTVRELLDHHADLRQSGISDGLSEQEAETRAGEKIGNMQEIVNEALAKKELKSVISLYPKTAFLLTPVLGYLLTLVASGLVVVGFITLMKSVNPDFPGYPTPAWFVFILQALVLFNVYVLPVLMAAFFVHAAKVRRVPLSLLVFCLLIICFLGSMLNTTILFPSAPGEQGVVGATINFFGFIPGPNRFSFDLMLKGIYRVTLILVSTGLVFRWVSRHENRWGKV